MPLPLVGGANTHAHWHCVQFLVQLVFQFSASLRVLVPAVKPFSEILCCEIVIISSIVKNDPHSVCYCGHPHSYQRVEEEVW